MSKPVNPASSRSGTCAFSSRWVQEQPSRPLAVRHGKDDGYSMNDNHPLSGVTVLVVEDDLLLAMDIEETLGGLGAVVVDVCHTLDEAMARAEADDFAVAVLDFSLGSDSVTPLARRLARRNV